MRPPTAKNSFLLIAVALLMIGSLTACGGTAGSSDPLRSGRDVYGARCSTCHGNRGQGGIGPAFSGVAETFPICDDQIRWITLGSERWKTEVGPVYGATGKSIEKVMPPMAEVLSPEQIASVAAFERSQYGGVEPDVALTDCGIELHNDN